MRPSNNKKLTIKSLLVISLCFFLLFVQMFQFHMHVGHIESSSDHGHVVDVHFDSASHTSHHESQHPTVFPAGHSAEIDVNHACVLCGIDLLKNVIPYILVLIIAFLVPHLLFNFNQYLIKAKLPRVYYLLYPSLRAPPF